MNALSIPSREVKSTKLHGKPWVVGCRRTSTYILTDALADHTSVVPSSQVFVVHKILAHGYLRAADAYDLIQFRITDGSAPKDMYFLAPTLAGQQGRLKVEWELGGRLVVPETFKIQAKITSNSDTVRLTVIGEYMGVQKARELGLYTAEGGQGCIGINNVDTAGVRESLIEAFAGYSIQILGLDIRGFANDGTTVQTATLEFGDGTNFFPVTKFFHKGTDVNTAVAVNTGLIDVAGPSGWALYVNHSKDYAWTTNVVYRYIPVDKTNTWDPTGRHNDHGIATGGDTNTLTDTARTGAKAWITDELVGAVVRIIAGTNAGESAIVVSNTDNDIEFAASSFTGSIGATSVYTIERPELPVTGQEWSKRQTGDKWWMYCESSLKPFPRFEKSLVAVEGMALSGMPVAGANLAVWMSSSVTTDPLFAFGPGLISSLGYVQPTNFETGTADAGSTATTLLDVAKTWTPDAWIGWQVRITAGTGAGQTAVVTDNDATSLTVASWSIATPDATSVYQLWEPDVGLNSLILDDLYLPWFGTAAQPGTAGLVYPPGLYVSGFTSNFGGLVWGRREAFNKYQFLTNLGSTATPGASRYQGT